MPKQAFRHILKEDILSTQPNNHFVKLIEPQNVQHKNTLREVEIVDIPDDTLILRADKMSSPLFRENDTFCNCHKPSRYRKKCDYIVVTEFDHNNYIIYIEMKTSARSQEHIPQLWCGRCFVEYLLFSISHFEKELQQPSIFIHRYVKFYSIPEDKDTTALTDDETNNIPPKMILVNDVPKNAYSCCVKAGIPIPIKALIYEYNH